MYSCGCLRLVEHGVRRNNCSSLSCGRELLDSVSLSPFVLSGGD